MLDRRTLPLSAMRSFESAGRHLHLGRAGAELGVTHGAVSHQIRALEDKLGLKLFIRANNKLQLTIAGEHLLKSVKEGLDLMVKGALNLNSDSIAGELIIGCTPTAGASWAVNHIMKFQTQYPQMRIKIVELQVKQLKIPTEIDIALCYGKPKIGDRRLESLITPKIFPVCSPSLLYGKPTIENSTQLAQLPLLYDDNNSWPRWFKSMHVKVPESTQKTFFFNTALTISAAQNGFGVALCNPLEVQDDLREGRLIRVLEEAIPESQNYYLLCNKPEAQSIRAKLFERWIKELMSNIPK